MTLTETQTDATDTEQLALLIGETASALLPADDAWSVQPVASGVPLPSGATVAVGAQLGDHVLAFVVSADMDRRIQVGPPPADGLTDGLTPALEAVAEVLGLGATGEMVEMDPAAVAAEAGDDSCICTLHDGDAHLVTIVISPPQDDAGGPEEPASFQPIVADGTAGSQSGLEVLHDVQMGVTVELGRTRMPLRDILTVVPGSVIELDRAASSPVDVMVNGTLIARGEVVVIDEEFGIRVTEIVGHEQSVHDQAAE